MHRHARAGALPRIGRVVMLAHQRLRQGRQIALPREIAPGGQRVLRMQAAQPPDDGVEPRGIGDDIRIGAGEIGRPLPHRG